MIELQSRTRAPAFATRSQIARVSIFFGDVHGACARGVLALHFHFAFFALGTRPLRATQSRAKKPKLPNEPNFRCKLLSINMNRRKILPFYGQPSSFTGPITPICAYLHPIAPNCAFFPEKKDCLFLGRGGTPGDLRLLARGRQINPCRQINSRSDTKPTETDRKMKSAVDLGCEGRGNRRTCSGRVPLCLCGKSRLCTPLFFHFYSKVIHNPFATPKTRRTHFSFVLA